VENREQQNRSRVFFLLKGDKKIAAIFFLSLSFSFSQGRKKNTPIRDESEKG
jgi:hypothetical protein